MGLPLAALLPIGGAVLGGVEGYKKSGGDLGAAALGSGLGALGGGGLRMAGSALVGQTLLANPVYRAVADKAARGAALTMPEMQMFKQATRGTGALAAGAGALGLPLAGSLAGNIAGGVSGPVQGAASNAAQLGAGLIGYTADGKPVYGDIGGGALPPGLGQYGPTSPYGGPLDVLGPAGMGQRLQTLKDAQTQRDVFRTLMPEVMEVREATAKKDLERNLAAAGVRQNIATRAAMQQAAQAAGLKAGLGAMQQAGQALNRVYQYQ